MTAIIIEDERLVACELTMKIAEIDASLKILEILPSVKTSLNWFKNNAEPDLVFADIQLADGESFEIFEKFSISCPIIFTTSYNEFAIKAFKVNGIDYLLKPVEPEELRRAIEKAKKINKSLSKPALDLNHFVEMLKNGGNSITYYKENFLCNFRNAWVPVKSEDIAYIMYDSLNYVFTFANEKYFFDADSMDEIENMLDPNKFFRVNRQFIVNRNAVQKIWGINGSKILVKLKEPYQTVEIDSSRQKAPVLKKWLEK